MVQHNALLVQCNTKLTALFLLRQHLVYCCGKLQPMACLLIPVLTCLKSTSFCKETTAWNDQKAVQKRSMS